MVRRKILCGKILRQGLVASSGVESARLRRGEQRRRSGRAATGRAAASRRPGCDGPKAQPFAQPWATPREALARAIRISAQRANASPRLQEKPLARWAAEKQPLREPFPWALPRAGRTRPLWGERFYDGPTPKMGRCPHLPLRWDRLNYGYERASRTPPPLVPVQPADAFHCRVPGEHRHELGCRQDREGSTGTGSGGGADEVGRVCPIRLSARPIRQLVASCRSAWTGVAPKHLGRKFLRNGRLRVS